MLFLYRPFFLSGPKFTYLPINNYISLGIVRPLGENKEVPQIGIIRNRKPEIQGPPKKMYTHFNERKSTLYNRLF